MPTLALQQRRSRSVPIAAALHALMLAQRARITDCTATARALDYSLQRWPALTRFLEDLRLPIDNNHDEQQIVPGAVSGWAFHLESPS